MLESEKISESEKKILFVKLFLSRSDRNVGLIRRLLWVWKRPFCWWKLEELLFKSWPNWLETRIFHDQENLSSHFTPTPLTKAFQGFSRFNKCINYLMKKRFFPFGYLTFSVSRNKTDACCTSRSQEDMTLILMFCLLLLGRCCYCWLFATGLCDKYSLNGRSEAITLSLSMLGHINIQ